MRDIKMSGRSSQVQPITDIQDGLAALFPFYRILKVNVMGKTDRECI